MRIRAHLDTVAEEIGAGLAALDPEALERAAGRIAEAERVFSAGAGRSGLAMRMFAMRLAQAGFDAHAVGDCTAPAAHGGDLLVIASGSGATPSMLLLAERAREIGAPRLVLTLRPESPLAREAEALVPIPLPADEARPAGLAGAQWLRTLFEQTLLVTLDTIAQAAAERAGRTEPDLQARHANLE
jgi:6-phospho-3-hexuloisomerase